MPFQEKKKERIKRYLLEKVREDDSEFLEKTIDNFGISATTAKRYLQDCIETGIIVAEEERRSGYALKYSIHTFSYEKDELLDEDKIYCEDISPLLADVTKEALSTWYYCFTEMMNNAIEHSQCKHIECVVRKDYLYTEISITDDGIGIYKNVQKYFKEKLNQEISYHDVVLEFYKGKMTTSPQNHSGEGIFFTSKALNECAIWSEETIYSWGCFRKEQFVESHLIAYYNYMQHIGTMVVMKLENQTKRTVKEVFDMFAPIDEGFVKTRIPIAEVCPFAEPIARSQARRILQRLEQFKEIEFDFSKVEFMGQGFADEVFRVFHNKYPGIQLVALNANPSVQGMIKHVQR